MINKVPKKALNKWTRFGKVEKWFILYCIILSLSIIFLPIIQIESFSWEQNLTVSIVNSYMWKLDIIILLVLLALIFWNISFRFKKIVYIILWFKANDSIINFLLLLILAISFISIQQTISFLWNSFSMNLTIHSAYYINIILIIIWIIWNLFLALNISKNKKKQQFINIIREDSQKEETQKEEEIKWLFEEEQEK